MSLVASAVLSLILWPLYVALQLPLWLAGFPICGWLAYREAWTLRPSPYFKRDVTAWGPRWAQAIWGNWEDGVTGPEWWTAGKNLRWAAFVWSAWRNPTNNLRFLPLINLVIVPARVRFVGNVDDPTENDNSDGTVKRWQWAFTWQGVYAGLVARWQITSAHHASVRIGWKLLPRDRNGLPDWDYRAIRCPFGVQLHPWRKS